MTPNKYCKYYYSSQFISFFLLLEQTYEKLSCTDKDMSVWVFTCAYGWGQVYVFIYVCIDYPTYACTWIYMYVLRSESFILGNIAWDNHCDDSTIVTGFSVLSVYASYMQDPCKYHTYYYIFGTHRTNLFWQFLLPSVFCECRMTTPCLSIMKIISQSNSEIGCSLIKQWDYMSASEQERWEETGWNRDSYWELFERKTERQRMSKKS